MPIWTITDFRVSWDIDNMVGVIQLLVATPGASPVNLNGLDAGNFSAALAALRSGDAMFYNPATKTILSTQ